MDYFDNSSLAESINVVSPLKPGGTTSTVVFLITGIIITASVAAIYIYKHHSLTKKQDKPTGP